MARLEKEDEWALCILVTYYVRKHNIAVLELGRNLPVGDDIRNKPALVDFMANTTRKYGSQIRDAFETLLFEDFGDPPPHIRSLAKLLYPARMIEPPPDIIAPNGLISKAINPSPNIMADISTAFAGIWHVVRYSAQIDPKPVPVKGGWDVQLVRASMQIDAAAPEKGQPFPTFTIHYQPHDATLSKTTGILLPLRSHVLFLGMDERTLYPLEIVAPIAERVEINKFSGIVLRKLEQSGVFITRVELFRAAGVQKLDDLNGQIGFKLASELRRIWREISTTDNIDDVLEWLRITSDVYDGRDGLLLDGSHGDKPAKAKPGRKNTGKKTKKAKQAKRKRAKPARSTPKRARRR